MLLSTSFWKAAGERAAKTFAQSLLAALTMTSAPVDVLHTNWLGALSLATSAAALSLYTSLGSVNVGNDSTPGAIAGRHRDLA